MKSIPYIRQILIFLFLLLRWITSFSQEWIRIYYDNIDAYPISMIESYDKGYIFGGVINQGQLPKYGFIFKTDINGIMLWDKKIGEYGDVTGVHDIQQTIDNGYIIIGSTKKLDPLYDPFIMKLNPCGEKEWCKILHLPENKNYGSYITQLPNGNYIGLLKYFSYDPGERIWLVCLNEDGEIVWKKVYGNENPYLNSEVGNDILISPDSNILITGQAYYPDLPDTNTYKTRSYFIKIDFNGEEKWSLVWGGNDQFYGHAVTSVVSQNGTIYAVGKHISYSPIPGEFPTLLKTSKTGEEITFYDISDSVSTGRSTTISWFADSTLVVGTGWKATNEEIFKPIIKYDTNGNILNIVDLGEDIYCYQSSLTTFNNKLLITSAKIIDGNFDIYAFKFNDDLEYDTIYTQPFVYDSLCPYPIVSDTIPLDCVVVGLEEERKEVERPQLTIVPNPAKDK
ncbi:MAG: hypothetical protein KAG99_01470, partial [Bacteroidales bacterium]|nr:hypothetical protein [Bacteroidales bacterium]